MRSRTMRVRLALILALAVFVPACAMFEPAPRAGIELSLERLAFDSRASFRFVVLGDSQFMDDAGFHSIVTQAQSLRPAFYFQVGDMIVTDRIDDPAVIRGDWAKYKRQSAPLTEPFFAVPGNHDSGTAAALKVWREVWGPRHYSFDHANAHFVVLDSCAKPGADAILGAEQTDWLRKDLAASRAEHVFVFLHHPLWLMSPKGWAAYHDLFKASRVKAVFAGHNHYYRYDRVDGIDYVMTIAVQKAQPRVEAGFFPHLIPVDVAGANVAASIFYQDENLPLDTVDPIVETAHRATYATVGLTTMPDKATETMLTLANPLDQPIHLSWRMKAERSGLRVTPDSGTVELKTKEKTGVPMKVEPTGGEVKALPDVEVEFVIRSRAGRDVPVRTVHRVLMTPDLGRLGVGAKMPGRVVLLGPEKTEAMTVILKAMGVTTVQVTAAAEMEKAWATLKPGDTLVTAHNALDNDSGLGAWMHEHRADVMKFLESGGRLIACLGYTDGSQPVIQDFGLDYRRHDRAWSFERKGDSSELHVPKGGPLAAGLIGATIMYRYLPMVSGWFELKKGDGWTALATDNLGEATVVARTVGKGCVIMSAARLAAHHHMAENYNQQRIWANLLLYGGEERGG